MRGIGENIYGRLNIDDILRNNNSEVIYTENFLNGTDMPLGLGMALAQNLEAMNYFASLPKEEQKSVIEHTHSISSKREMREYVSSLGGQGSK